MFRKAIWITILLAMCIILYAQAGYAFGLLDLNLYFTPYYCHVDTGLSVGTLYAKALSSCNINSDAIFTAFVCTYEGIIGDVFGELLCGFMHAMQNPFWAMIVLYITFVGIMILTGQLPFTARDGVFTILKIALVIVFATEPSFLVNILFKGLFAAIQEGIFLVLYNTVLVTGELPSSALLGQMDSMLSQFINESVAEGDEESQCSGGALTMMLSFAASMPPLAMLAVTMMFKLFMVFARAILGYLLSITGIMFLLTLAPIFLSLALFTITRSFFDTWLKFLLSFVIQIVVVFAFIGFVISLDLRDDFEELFELAAPYSMTNWVESVRVPQNICTFCNGSVNGDSWSCDPNARGMAPFEMVQDANFVSWVSSKLLYLLFISYLLEAILTAAPTIARHLSGSVHAPTLGGVPIDNQSTAIAGGSVLGNVGRNFSNGFRGTSGALNKRVSGGAKQAKDVAIGRTQQRSAITDMMRGVVGLK